MPPCVLTLFLSPCVLILRRELTLLQLSRWRIVGEMAERLLEAQNPLRVKTETGAERIYYPVFHEGIPEEFKHLPVQKLRETAVNRGKCLRKLKEFMRENGLSATEDILTTVMRVCKYDPKKSAAKLKSFLRSRQNIIQKLCRVDEKKIDYILSDTLFTVLPYRDKEGRAILLTKPTIDMDKYSMNDVEPVAMSLVLYLMTFPMTTVCGMTYVLECKSDSVLVYYPIIKAFRPYIYYGLDFPVRIKRLDLVNENVFSRFFYNTVCHVLPKKVTKRIFLHGSSYKSLHNAFPPEMLPKDLEGDLGPISHEFYRERLINFMKTLKEEAING